MYVQVPWFAVSVKRSMGEAQSLRSSCCRPERIDQSAFSVVNTDSLSSAEHL
jgi:hypothetical protein